MEGRETWVQSFSCQQVLSLPLLCSSITDTIDNSLILQPQHTHKHCELWLNSHGQNAQMLPIRGLIRCQLLSSWGEQSSASHLIRRRPCGTPVTLIAPCQSGHSHLQLRLFMRTRYFIVFHMLLQYYTLFSGNFKVFKLSSLLLPVDQFQNNISSKIWIRLNSMWH